jgi:M6 family metalloprotease domain
MKKFYAIYFICFIFSSANLFAVPAYPLPIDVNQPGGTKLTITLKGDEHVSWAESSDGYTLLRNSDNFWEYAQRNAQGDLVLSGRIAKNIQQRDVADNVFLSQIQKKMGYSSSQAEAFNQIKQARQQAMDKEIQRASFQSGTTPQRAPHISGVVRAPLILVDFPGKPFTRTAAEFEMLCNQLNYTATSDGAITGSVNDYFKASSYSQLDFQVDVWGPYTMNNDLRYYDNESGGNSQEMAREAAIAAHNAGCNFADYDIDSDGYVDGLHIIYAGYDQSAGEPAGQGMWAHAWAIQNTTLTLDGKRIFRFSCSSELRNNSSYPADLRNKITYIGVICHELSHVFGLPDLYDTDYSGSGGTSIHIAEWCLMASGSWNNEGMTPALHSAWCRNELGWVTITTLEDPADVTIPNPAIQCDVYKINHY